MLAYTNNFYDKKLRSINLEDFQSLCSSTASKKNLKRAMFSTVFIDEHGLAHGDNATEETTGILAVDIDHIPNPKYIREKLFELPYCVHSQLSYSGNGVWGIVKHNINVMVLLPLVIDIIEQFVGVEIDINCTYSCSGRSLNLDPGALHRGFGIMPLVVPSEAIIEATTIKTNTNFRIPLETAKPYGLGTFENRFRFDKGNACKHAYIVKVLDTISRCQEGSRWLNAWKAITTAKKALGDLSPFASEIGSALQSTGLTRQEISRLMKLL